MPAMQGSCWWKGLLGAPPYTHQRSWMICSLCPQGSHCSVFLQGSSPACNSEDSFWGPSSPMLHPSPGHRLGGCGWSNSSAPIPLSPGSLWSGLYPVTTGTKPEYLCPQLSTGPQAWLSLYLTCSLIYWTSVETAICPDLLSFFRVIGLP